jgi:predicted SAM-dependent methyltransferase
MRIYIGCGSSPIDGWLNLDNSLTVKIAKLPLLAFIFCRSPLQRTFVEAVRQKTIEWADATKHIPAPDRSVDVLYSCHMLEHLDRSEAKSFLAEAKRVLKPAGVLRIVVPDIRKQVDQYLADGDADALIAGTLLSTSKPKTISAKFRWLLYGHRNHHWMYDEHSMIGLLQSSGFRNIQALEPGATTITEPDGLNLFERAGESIFVEATI